jgi:hypothetical protein
MDFHGESRTNSTIGFYLADNSFPGGCNCKSVFIKPGFSNFPACDVKLFMDMELRNTARKWRANFWRWIYQFLGLGIVFAFTYYVLAIPVRGGRKNKSKYKLKAVASRFRVLICFQLRLTAK